VKKQYVLVNKKRFLIIVLVLLSIVISTTLLVTRRPEGKGDNVYIERTIACGDTLWDIAVEISDGTIDIRRLVFEIKKINGLNDSNLYLGQVIKLPSF